MKEQLLRFLMSLVPSRVLKRALRDWKYVRMAEWSKALR